MCVCVLWTHCLAKSLWGSLNRLCFPSGESIQVTDTESWLHSEWPLKSWKCLLIWHLTISDVAVEYKTQFNHPALSHLGICFPYLSTEEEIKCRQRWKDCALGVLWLDINAAKVRQQMNDVRCTSQRRCCFLLLLHCLIGVIPDCYTSLVWMNGHWHSVQMSPLERRVNEPRVDDTVFIFQVFFVFFRFPEIIDIYQKCLIRDIPTW